MKFYLDTSTWGGFHDAEFAEWTVPFIEQARAGRFITVLSDVTNRELLPAPEKTRNLPASTPLEFLEYYELNEEQKELSLKYIKEGALTMKQETDAEHIAMATILKVDTLVSWNFRHMVNFFRLKQYNSINLKYGYSIIDIRTPREIIYEDK
jgi:hypothetical protein